MNKGKGMLMEKSHYLFIGNLNNYKNKKTRTKQLKRLLVQCELYFKTELSVTHPKGSSTYMAFAELNLALAYLLTEDEKYLKEAKRWILCICGYEKWGHAHLVNVDLSASWNLFGLSLAYNWLYDVLDENTRIIAKDKITLQSDILCTYAKENNQDGWVVHYLQNHNWINFTGLAAAGYALGNQEYIEMAKSNFDIVYPLLSEDGSDYEGVVYWRYGAMWLFIYAHLLKCEEKIDLFKENKFLKNTFYYRVYQSAPDLSRQINFGDTHDTHSGHPACIYRLIAKEYKNEVAQYYASYVIDNLLKEEDEKSKVKPGILPEAFLEYLFFDPNIAETSVKVLPLFKFFPDLGLVSIRSSWKKDAKVFSYKCGYPGGKKQWLTLGKMKEETGIEYRGLSHNHPDHLSYIIVNGDKYFTSEDGYNRNIMASHHSSLLVDDRLCEVHNVNDVYLKSFLERVKNSDCDIHKENEAYKGEIKNLKYENNLLTFNSEAHNLYPKELQLKKVERRVICDNKDFVAFVDSFESDTAHIYSCLCNTNEKALAVTNDTEIKNCLKYHYPETQMCYYIIPIEENTNNNPFLPTFATYSITSVMTTQEPDKVCHSDIQSLKHETKQKFKKYKMVELITYKDNLKITFNNDELKVGNFLLYRKTK